MVLKPYAFIVLKGTVEAPVQKQHSEMMVCHLLESSICIKYMSLQGGVALGNTLGCLLVFPCPIIAGNRFMQQAHPEKARNMTSQKCL